MLALVRVNPEYRNQLPLMKQLECLVKNFFKSTQEIGQERLESVQIYIGDFCTALSEEHVDAINKGFANLKKNYQDRCQQAKKVDRSTLYTLMKKAFDGPIAAIINQFNQVDPKQLELEEENRKLEEQLKKSQETIEKLEQGKTEINEKLQESEAKRIQDQKSMYEMHEKLMEYEVKRMQDKIEAAADVAQYKAELDAKMKQIMDFMKKQQPASTSSISDMPESSNTHFFKP